MLKFIISGFLPFTIVENEWFKRFCYILNKNYSLPSRKHVSNILLEDLFNDVSKKIKLDLIQASSIAVTTDPWTSKHQKCGFLGVTVH